jgi:hypothetical protein
VARKPALGLDPGVAVGTPEQVVKERRSYTGAFLKPVLAKARAACAMPTKMGLRRRSSSRVQITV